MKLLMAIVVALTVTFAMQASVIAADGEKAETSAPTDGKKKPAEGDAEPECD